MAALLLITVRIRQCSMFAHIWPSSVYNLFVCLLCENEIEQPSERSDAYCISRKMRYIQFGIRIHLTQSPMHAYNIVCTFIYLFIFAAEPDEAQISSNGVFCADKAVYEYRTDRIDPMENSFIVSTLVRQAPFCVAG